MTIHWSLFVPGLVMLLFPADRLLSSAVELRSFASFQSLENSPRHRPWWWVPVLWLDPLRGFLGTFLLRHALGLTGPKWIAAATTEYVLLVAILALGVLAQLFTRRGERDILLAPLGFVAGMALALTPWAVGLLGIVSAGLGLFAFRQFPVWFAGGAAAIVVLGLAFNTEAMWIAPAAAVLALPLAAALVTGRTFELPTRNTSDARIPLLAPDVPR